MKKTVLSVVLVFASILSAWAYEERNLLQKAAGDGVLEDVLITGRQWVKYPGYADRAGWNALLGENRDAFIARGERFLDYDWKVVKLTDYLDFARTGTRATQEEPHNTNIGAVAALFMAEMAEGEGRFLDQLANGIFHLCEMTTWSISAHLVNQRAGGVFPVSGDHVIELASGDLGATLSWIYYFLGREFDRVHPRLAPRLLHEIGSRILDPYLNDTHFWWMATGISAENPGMVNNWNVWCNANVLQCFLLVEEDRERLLRGVHKTIASVDKFINYNNVDGACEEGPSYWGHAAGKLYDYLQLLQDATGGRISIFNEPIIRNMGEYISRSYVADGWVVNFADASARDVGDYRLIWRYGRAVGSSEMERFAAHLGHVNSSRITTSRDTYRLLADLASDKLIDTVEAAHTATPFTWYPDTQFCYMSAGDWFLAAKGGYNDESHNHNDVGTFSLWADGRPVLIDVGVGTYSAKTFSRERYSIWTMQSDYHNLPQIDGVPQSYGRNYRTLDPRADERRKTFSLDVAGAYPADAGIRRWVRSYRLSKSGLEITDSFEIADAETPNRLHFMTRGRVDVSQAGVIEIDAGDKTCRLAYDKNTFEPNIETITLDDPKLSRVWGNRIVRITLLARTVTDRGTYKIYVKN